MKEDRGECRSEKEKGGALTLALSRGARERERRERT